jgi:ABC-type cobalamin/Fe3+-siderophores transport system ATPase subunit
MRLKEIKVKKLFGVFDHSIPLKMEDRITIIHGLNGYGKTTILQMVQAVMQGQFSRLRKVPFAELSLAFDNEQELRITRTEVGEGEQRTISHVKLNFDLRQAGKSIIGKPHTLEPSDASTGIGMPPHFVSQHIEDLEQVGPDTWLEVSSGRQLDLDEVIEIYGDYLPIPRRKVPHKLPDWLLKFTKSFEVRLIAAQRLLNVGPSKRSRNISPVLPVQPAVQIYSQELSGKIQQVQAQYGAKSQELDSSFAGRAIKGSSVNPIDPTELEAKLQKLEERRKGIIAAGLLPADHNVAAIQGAKIEEGVKNILALHASDVEQKLGVFDAIVAKVELLKELVNRRYTFKKLEVDRQSGFRLVSDSGAALQPTDLSSGEQHELVLFYELLFRTQENALILIDEPELSLHVAWQSEFLKDLERVVQLSSLDVVLATHSPQIIANRWDLTVELGSPAA